MPASKYYEFEHKCEWTDPQGREHSIVIRGSISPADPGCRYTRNGDGWPETPAGIEDYIIETSDGIEISDDDGKIIAEFEDKIMENYAKETAPCDDF